MAERRMFAKTIIDSDAFLDMPISTQCLYFHLAMRADDEGFINKPKSILRTVGTSEDDLKLLIAKRFIIPFESGIVVIKHWKIHNYIQKDRFKATKYTDEKELISVNENGVYKPKNEDCIQSVSNMDTQVRLGKVRLGKDNKDIVDVIDYLNLQTGKKFKSTTPKTKTLIMARLKEGFTLDDFKSVIDNKCREWQKDVKMSKYLRPETLFGTKFESYLNERGNNGADRQHDRPHQEPVKDWGIKTNQG